MNLNLKLICGVFGLLFCFLSAHSQSYTINMNILNPPNENGQVVIIAGKDIQIEFSILDNDHLLSKDDVIRLVKTSTNRILDSKKRGTNPAGSVLLNTNGSQGNPDLGECLVQYVHNGSVVQVTPLVPPQFPIVIVTDEVAAQLVSRIESVESAIRSGQLNGKSAYQLWLENGNTGTATDFLASLKGAKGDTGEQGAAGPIGPQGPEGKPADLSSYTGNIVPSQTNVYSLGSPTQRWKDLYIGQSSIYFYDNSNNLTKLSTENGGLEITQQDAEGNPTGDTYVSPWKKNTPGTGIVYSQGKIGVGTADDYDPAEKVEVVGNVKAEKFIGDGSMLTNIPAGPQGIQGNDGKSSYQIWLEQGNTGSETDFLNSLKGEPGDGILQVSGNEISTPANSIFNISNVLNLQPQTIAPFGTLGSMYANTNKKLYFHNGDEWCEVLLKAPSSPGNPLPIATDYSFLKKFNLKEEISPDCWVHPLSFTLDSYNNIYVLSDLIGTALRPENPFYVRKYSSNGTFVKSWQVVKGIKDIKIDGSNVLYVLANPDGNNRIYKYDTDGNQVGIIELPDDLTIDYLSICRPLNLLYCFGFLNYGVIYKYTNNGSFITQYNLTNMIDGNEPNTFSVNERGDLFLTYNNGLCYLAAGSNTFEFNKYPQYFSQGCTFRIDIDKTNCLYVNDCYDFSIRKIDSNGNLICQIGGFGTGDGQFSTQNIFIDFDNLGNVYILDTYSMFLSVFAPSAN